MYNGVSTSFSASFIVDRKAGEEPGTEVGTFRSCKLDFTTVSLSSWGVWYVTECMLLANEGIYTRIHTCNVCLFP